MLEKRLTERLITHWNSLKKEEYCPEFSRISLAPIADLMPNCLLMRAQPLAESLAIRYLYSEIGDKAAAVFFRNPLNTHFSTSMQIMPAARLMRRMDELTIRSEPIVDEGHFVNERSKTIKFRSCLLPFGSNGQLTHVLVGLSWREF